MQWGGVGVIPQYVRQHSWLGGCWVGMEVVEGVWRGGQQCGSHHHKEGGGNKEGSGNRCCGLSAANFPTIAFLLLLLLLIMLNILFLFENIKKNITIHHYDPESHLSATEGSKRSDNQDREDAHQEGEDGRQKETPPFSFPGDW